MSKLPDDTLLWDDRVFYEATKKTYSSTHAVERFRSLLLPLRKRQLREEFDFFLSLLPNGGRVLDVGCGTGKDVATLLSLGFDAEGIDVSAPMLEIARREVGNRFRLLDVRDVGSLPEKSYDGICCVAVLQHVASSDLDRVFQGIKSTLRCPGNLFIFTKRGRGRTWDTRLGDVHKRATAFYSLKELERLLSRNRFTVLRSAKFTLVRIGRSDNWLTITASLDSP